MATAKQQATPEETREARIAKLLEKARAAEQAGDRRGALRLLEAAPEDLRIFGSWHYARGAMLVREDQLIEGIKALGEAMKRDPDVPEVLANLGGALVELSRRPGTPLPERTLAEGTKVLEKAVDLGPKLSNARVNLGLAYHLAGRLEEAAAVLAGELARNPDDPAAQHNYAAVQKDLAKKA